MKATKSATMDARAMRAALAAAQAERDAIASLNVTYLYYLKQAALEAAAEARKDRRKK